MSVCPFVFPFFSFSFLAVALSLEHVQFSIKLDNFFKQLFLSLIKLMTSFDDFKSKTDLSNSSEENTSFFNSLIILVSMLLSEYRADTSIL